MNERRPHRGAAAARGFVVRPSEQTEIRPEDAVRLARYEPGRGGVLVDPKGRVEVHTADGRLVATASLQEVPEGFIDEYLVADLFPDVTWYIGAPFDRRVTIEVQWRQTGIDCGGELRVEGLRRGGDEIPFSWEIVVSNNATLFARLPGYEVDVSFPVDAYHDRRDIVLRRRLAEQVLAMCAGAPGSFRVHKNDRKDLRVNNFFRGRPPARNLPVITTLGVDIYEARRRGSRY